MSAIATAEEIADVQDRRVRCRALWNPNDFITILTKFYHLLIDTGHWPANGFSLPPPEGWDNAIVQRMSAQGYSEDAIALMKRLPYANDSVLYESECDVFSDCRPADLRNESVLKSARNLQGSGTGAPDAIPIMLQRTSAGFIVMLDIELSAIHSWNFLDPIGDLYVEFCVQRHLDGYDNLSWQAIGDCIDPDFHRYQPFTPAIPHFQNLYDRFHSLRFLPLLPRDEADRDFDLSRVIDMWHRGFLARKRSAVVELYSKHGWPDEFDRDALLKDWKKIRHEFEREDKMHFEDSNNDDVDDDDNDDASVDSNGNRIYQTDSESDDDEDHEDNEDA